MAHLTTCGKLNLSQPLVVILDGGWELEYRILNTLYVVCAGAKLQRGYTGDSHRSIIYYAEHHEKE